MSKTDKPLDLVKVAKLLQLFTSDMDGEALNAIRRANEMLSARKLMWSDLLVKTADSTDNKTWSTQDRAGVHGSTDVRTQKEIEGMFGCVFSSIFLSESTRKFLESISNYFNARGYLTPKQYAVLYNKHAQYHQESDTECDYFHW